MADPKYLSQVAAQFDPSWLQAPPPPPPRPVAQSHLPPPKPTSLFDYAAQLTPVVETPQPPPPGAPPGAPPVAAVAPTPAAAAAPAGPTPSPGPAGDPQADRYVPIGGGPQVVAAREMDLRGPTLKAAQSHSNEVAGETIGNIGGRNEDAAAAEFGMYVNQERQAHSRQRAAEQAAAERDEELYQRQQDFDQSVKSLSQASLDPDRFWSSRSTAQKVSGMIGIALGGFLRGARGGSNPALDMINTAIERDIKAQEFGYMAARDGAQQKQTAFALAMQKYNSVDAARSLARASAMDAVQAQLGQAKAQYAGTEAANRADMAMAQLEQDKTNQIAQGIRFIPQQVVGGQRKFLDRRFGTLLTENQMIARGDKIDDREHDFGKIETQGEVDLTKGVALEEAKSRVEKDKNVRAQMVQLPNGDVIRAPSDGEATKLRDLSQAVRNAQALVNEAKTIRNSGTNWRFAGTKERARLESIQSELTLAFKDRGGLGALSGPDMDLALGATGDITSQMGKAEAKLDTFMSATNRALRSRVASIPDAPGTAKGEMPKSIQYHDGKK
jgi:hypothetical protein